MTYKKVEVSFKDRLIFLFTGLLNEKYLPVVEKQTVVYNQTVQDTTINSINNTKENFTLNDEKLDIPFFELDTSKVKSNL